MDLAHMLSIHGPRPEGSSEPAQVLRLVSQAELAMACLPSLFFRNLPQVFHSIRSGASLLFLYREPNAVLMALTSCLREQQLFLLYR